ncbi:hypothetical protein FE810_04295 [Thalassotalea litorea]|uniref:Tetratricopeptide repeat protein n=1 Tax=Thalassotalea litorea TaxID=2020715 RepID=A0A5R9IRP9_9GAMM|nr:hypothetical protein [Thalassotalea litorea]TLU66737.1 hypothetical protein FE810_04295 [Thalassotalea litorea]
MSNKILNKSSNKNSNKRLNKSNYSYKALLLSILTASAAAEASESSELSALEQPFKVAVVKNAPGSNAIVSGEFAVGASELTSSEMDKSQHFEKAMGLCALHIKTGEYAVAKSACSEAVTAVSGFEDSHISRTLSAMAYSNRAIVKYFTHDTLGAFTDFSKALEYSSDTIVMDNLTRLNVAYLKSQVTPSSEAALSSGLAE